MTAEYTAEQVREYSRKFFVERWRPGDNLIVAAMLTAYAALLERQASAVPEWVEFVEPANKRADPQFVRVSKETAIQCAREAAEQAGHFDLTNEQLLENFMAVNWATLVAAPQPTKDAQPVDVTYPALLTGTTPDGRNYSVRGTVESVTALSDYLAKLEESTKQPVNVSTEWHAPGLGEVHSDDNTLMIFCTHASDDSEAGEIVDDDLAKWVCAAMNVDVAAIRAAAWSVASNLGEHMEGYHHDSELVAYVNEQLDVLTRAIGGVK